MLHETTQRRVCRIVFLAGCVLPTILVFAAVGQLWLPGYADRWEVPLGQLFDCGVRVQQVGTPKPGKYRFGRIALADLEIGTELARFEGVTYAFPAGRTSVSVAHATVYLTAGRELGVCLERLLRGHESDDVTISFAKLELASSSESVILLNVRARLSFRESGSHIAIWSIDDPSAPRLSMERNSQLNPPATRITFDTGSQPILCELLSAWDHFDQLGGQARFIGRIELTASRDSARGHLTGRFSHLHPSPTVASANFPTDVHADELGWSTGRPNSLEPMPAGPVAAVLAQFTQNEPDSAEKSAGEVAWELAPWLQ